MRTPEGSSAVIDSPPTDTSSSLPSDDNDDDYEDDDDDWQTGVTNDKVSQTTDDKTWQGTNNDKMWQTTNNEKMWQTTNNNKIWQTTDDKGDKMPSTVGHRHRPLFHGGGRTSSQPHLDIFGQFEAKTVHEGLIHG